MKDLAMSILTSKILATGFPVNGNDLGGSSDMIVSCWTHVAFLLVGSAS